MDIQVVSTLWGAAIGGAIGIAGTVIANKAAARVDRKRRREELLASILDAADRAEDEPLSTDPLYVLARLGVLGTHDLSADLRARVDSLIQATRRFAHTHHVSNRLEEGGADLARREKATDDFASADEAVTEARLALIEAIRAELGRE